MAQRFEVPTFHLFFPSFDNIQIWMYFCIRCQALKKMEIANVLHLLELQHLTVKAGLITFLEMLSFLFTRKNVEEKTL